MAYTVCVEGHLALLPVVPVSLVYTVEEKRPDEKECRQWQNYDDTDDHPRLSTDTDKP